MYDAVIIGAGPAGTSAGYDLARNGHRVLILDRRPFPRKKACAGGITPKALNLFAYDISHLILRTCREVKITRPDGKSFVVADKQPLCYMVQRQDLDFFSLNKARAAGAEFRTIDRILSIDPYDLGQMTAVRLRVGIDGRETGIEARYVIGSDGANSSVRRLLTGKSAPETFGKIVKLPAIEADVRVDNPWSFPMAFDFSTPAPGYYWIFPRHDHVNIGIFAARPEAVLSVRDLAAYAMSRLGTDVLGSVKGYPIAVQGQGIGNRCFGSGQVLLAGDAAGLAEPLLGEGIYAAIASGRLAARAVHLALIRGERHALKRYQHSLSRLNLDLWLYRTAARALYRHPRSCLSLAGLPFLHRRFSRGYAAGRSLSRILFPF